MTPQETLIKAAELLESSPSAWIQNQMALDRDNDPVLPNSHIACQWCVLGAIAKVQDRPGACHSQAANLLLASHLNVNVAQWNDSPFRTLPTPRQGDTPVTIGFIAESNGFLDAIWCIRAEPYSPELKAKCVELANFISDHAEADENQVLAEAVQRRCSYVGVRTLSHTLSDDLFRAASITVTKSYKLKDKIIELFS